MSQSARGRCHNHTSPATVTGSTPGLMNNTCCFRISPAEAGLFL